MSVEFINTSGGDRLAFEISKRSKDKPTLVFLGGFRSDMSGNKATELARFAQAQNWSYLRLDYAGHGQSSGEFQEGTISRWVENALAVVNHATHGPLLLVGSSMGGWIMTLAALALKKRVCGLVGIAIAPDFTERLLWNRFDSHIRAQLLSQGCIFLPSNYDDEPFPITRELIEDGRKHLLLDDLISIDCPVRLIHGQADEDVPYDLSLAYASALSASDVVIQLVKGGDHRLSSPAQLRMINNLVQDTMALAIS